MQYKWLSTAYTNLKNNVYERGALILPDTINYKITVIKKMVW